MRQVTSPEAQQKKRELILLVEDNPDIMRINSFFLSKAKGYRVEEATTLEEAERMAEAHGPDLVVMDILMPDGSGMDFCKKLRTTKNTPVLFLSALSENKDIIEGLHVGGDDFISKPYDLDVLSARIEALLRRAGMEKTSARGDIYKYKNFTVDYLSRRAYVNDMDILLKNKEFSLMEVMLKNKDVLYSAEQLYSLVWGMQAGEDVRTIKAHISRIRHKLSDACPLYVEAVRGRGYRMTERESKK